MASPNFPSTGLVADVTTFQVGDINYLWDGEKWKSITGPLSHGLLSNRAAADSHPISAISGVADRLALSGNAVFASTADLLTGTSRDGVISDATFQALVGTTTQCKTDGFYAGSTSGSANYTFLNEADSTAAGYVTGYSRFQVKGLNVYACLVVEDLSIDKLGGVGDGVTDNTASYRAGRGLLYNLGGGELSFPEGVFLFSGSGMDTAVSNSYYRTTDPSITITGSGFNTVFTRGEDQGSDVIDFSDASTFHDSLLNIHSSNNVYSNFRIEDCKSAIYMGQIDGEVDTCHVSMNRFKNIWIVNCGVGIHMRSGVGCYYNTLSDVHVWQCQVSEYIDKHPSTLILSPNNNRNQFRHVRNARSHVGLWLKSGDTNQFIGQHNEGNSTSPTSNRYPVPSLPYGLSGGVGQLLETNAINNSFKACMQEACEVELVNDGVRNSFDGLYRDEVAGKVRHLKRPYFYSTRTMSVTNGGNAFYFTNSQSDIFSGYKTGVIHNEVESVNSRVTSLGSFQQRVDGQKTTSTDVLINVGPVSSGATFSEVLWADSASDFNATTARFEINIVGNCQASNLAHDTSFKVLALRNNSGSIIRYYIYGTESGRATGLNSGDSSEPFSVSLSLDGKNLDIDVTAPARDFENVVMKYTRIIS